MRRTIRRSSGTPCVGRFHGLLQLDRARDRVHRAGELHQHAVSHHFDDPAVMRGDQWLEDVSTPRLKGGQRTGLIRLHQAAVADHIGGQNGSKTALGAFFGHLVPFVLHAAVQQIVGAPRREVYRPGVRDGCKCKMAGRQNTSAMNSQPGS